MLPFSKDILTIIVKCKDSNLKTFAILPPQIEIVQECVSNGLYDFAFQDDSDKSIECRINKALNCKQITNITALTFKYLTYIQESRIMYIKSTKVLLTQCESIFINYLFTNCGNCNIDEFTKYFSLVCGKQISKKCVVVGINRLRRKVITQTGYDFLKTRYAYGYTIRY